MATILVCGGGVGLAVLAKAVIPKVLSAARQKKSSITPLCPGLIKQHILKFTMKIDGQINEFDVLETGEHNTIMCSIDIKVIDGEVGPAGVGATVTLKKQQMTLATLVFRKTGDIVLCRAGCEIFGFVRQQSGNQYQVSHRNGEGLLTVSGDIAVEDVVILNANRSPICFARRRENMCECQVGPDSDAGLVILSLIATHVNRKIQGGAACPGPQQTPSDPLSAALLSTKHPESESEALSILNQVSKRSTPLKWLPPVSLAAYLACGAATLLPFLQGPLRQLAGGAFVLAALSSIRAGFTDPGTIPDSPVWQPGNENSEQVQLLQETKRSGGRRLCKWTNLYKPDRAHYCRVSRRCVLVMDHYTPWLNNCVGFRNHRFFFQALLWGGLGYVLVLTSMPSAFRAVFDSERQVLSRAWILAASLGAVVDSVLIGAFFSFHAFLLYINMTTIEYCEKRNRRNYKPPRFVHKWGAAAANPIKWLLPVDPPLAEEGVHTNKA